MVSSPEYKPASLVPRAGTSYRMGRWARAQGSRVPGGPERLTCIDHKQNETNSNDKFQ